MKAKEQVGVWSFHQGLEKFMDNDGVQKSLKAKSGGTSGTSRVDRRFDTPLGITWNQYW